MKVSSIRLVAETPGKFRILPPDYCTPEETPTGHEAILVLQKSRCINVESVKGAAKPQNFFQRKWEASAELAALSLAGARHAAAPPH